MKVNLIVLKYRFTSTATSAVRLDFNDFDFGPGVKIVKTSRIDFCFKGNKCSLTSNGYGKLYLSHNIKKNIIDLREYFNFLIDIFYKHLSDIKYTVQVCNLHASGTLKNTREQILEKLKYLVSENIQGGQLFSKEFDSPIPISLTPFNFPHVITQSQYVQHAFACGTLRYNLLSSNYTLIAKQIQGIQFFKQFIESQFQT